MRILLFLITAVVLSSACKKEVDQAAVDEGIIKKYLKDNNLTATRHSSGLYYIIGKSGYGNSPNYYSTVKVTYKGYLTDGTVFDKTAAGSTFEYPLSNLIQGWQIGIPLLHRSGSGTFFIPSGLGYGSSASGDIPANSVLIFDISLIDFY
jgi:FKBP-type peptidyl-prolyl cis-trans isomerase FkpA